MAQTFRDIIGLWASPDALAAELGAKPETVRKWRQRDNIPVEWWMLLVDAAKTHGHELTTYEMARIAARPSGEASHTEAASA